MNSIEPNAPRPVHWHWHTLLQTPIMASTQIQTLLQPPRSAVSEEQATALLNASFPTLASLNTGSALDDAIHAARSENNILNNQTDASQADLRVLVWRTRTQTNEELVTAKELALLRHSLADELLNLTEELDSSANDKNPGPSLLEEIELLHRNLKELQSVKSYVEVIHRALQLSENSVKVIHDSSSSPVSQSSIEDYVQLKTLVNSVKKVCMASEAADMGEGVKLLSYLSELSDKTWHSIKDALSSTLLSAADSLHWPMPVDYTEASSVTRKTFEFSFANLLKLQELGESIHKGDNHTARTKDGIYPLQALIRPVAQRFKYHFDGTRQTNRLDKPEWYFAHIINITHEHKPFLDSVIQPLLQQFSRYSKINAWREFTRLLLPIISRKLNRSMALLLPHPSLLAHTVYQALSFDDALRQDGFSLTGTLEGDGDKPRAWEGTSEIILGSTEWFDAWLEGERKFSEEQYNGIISSSDTWQFTDDADEDAISDQHLRPTNSARRVKALIEQITDRYRPLPRFIHQTRFLIAVQVPILELYHTRISESLDAFETLSSFLVRAVPGALAGQVGHGRDAKGMTAGVEGSQRLVKALVSAKWMAEIMAAWGEDIFFLELWHQICEKSSLKRKVEEVDALPNPTEAKDEGTIFDELVAQYNTLAARAEDMLIKQVCGEVEADLKNHFYRQSSPVEDDGGLSQSLLGPIARLSSHLSFLSKTLPSLMSSELYNSVAKLVAAHIVQRQILYRGRGGMSAREGRTVLEEANLWVEASRMAMSPAQMGRVDGPWAHLLEAGRMLSLEGELFNKLVSTVKFGRKKEYEELVEGMGVCEMTIEEATDVLSIREDY